MTRTAIQRRWDLWNLQTLFPGWGEAECERLLAAGAACDERQRVLFADPAAARQQLAAAAAAVLATYPELATGLTLSLHVGPYSLAPVPWLVTGRDVHVLVNRTSLAEIRPIYDALQGELALPGRVVWVPIEGGAFALKLLRALRRNQPVFAFLDGNDGLDGCEGTLRHGVRHRLPGRDIRVRTGLARLALGLRCPVHSLVTVWQEGEGLSWERGPTWRWPRGTNPVAATHELFDWAFSLITRHPEQWRAWNMLTGVYESFRDDRAADPEVLARARRVMAPEFREQRLIWVRRASLWPGDMLEDVQAGCFYDAGGLTAVQLDSLQRGPGFTPDDACERLGPDAARSHLPRLLALGFVQPALAGGGAG